MKKPNWIVLACVVALIGVTGCSDDDDPLDIPNGDVAAAETVLNNALAEFGDPLGLVGQLLDLLIPFVPPASPFRVVPCEVTCTSGTVECLEGGPVTFDSCEISGTNMIVTGTLTVDAISKSAAFTNVTINDSPPISGTAAIVIEDSCRLTLENFSIGDSVINGSVFLCEDDPYPTEGSLLVITVVFLGDTYVFEIEYNGTSTATATVTVDARPVATCTVDLDALDGDCTAI
jgi:hypothetical protein